MEPQDPISEDPTADIGLPPADDSVMVSLGGAPEAPADETNKPPESINLVDVYTDEELGEISGRVTDDFYADVESRSEHMSQLKRWYELYASVTKPKNFPFQGAANVNAPLLTYATLQVHGRLFDMLIPSKGNIYNSMPTKVSDPEEIDRAERTELYINWMIREKIPEYRMSYDDTFWQVLIFGSAFRYFFWDESEKRIRAEWVGVEDMVVSYKCKVTDPSMRGVPRYTLVRWMSLYDLEGMSDDGIYSNVETLSASSADAQDSEFRQVVDKVDGKSPAHRAFVDDEDRKILEQHCKIRTPNDPTRHPSFDGKPHPVVITVDDESNKVLRIVLREEDDPADARRFTREKSQYDQSVAANQMYQASQGMHADPMTGQLMPMQAPPPMPAEPKKTRQREVCFFTHYKGFPGEGFYGLGFGSFIGPLNEAYNTILNQKIDRATVNNSRGGFISRQLKFQRGDITSSPGKWVEIDAPPAAMRDGLQPMPMIAGDPDADRVLSLIEMMSNRTSGSGDTLSGEPIGSNETARAAMARNENAQKQISVLGNRILGYLTCDARLMWRLLSVYMDEEEYQEITDPSGKPRQIKIGRADFIADARVVPTADARATSHAQREESSTNFLQFVMGTPNLAQNPQLVRFAEELVMRAKGMHEAIDLMGPPPQPPAPPPPKPQWEENAEFLRDHDQPTNEQDNDDEHLMEIMSFKADPIGYQMLSPTGKKMFDAHERGHLAQKIEKEHKNGQQPQPSEGLPGGPLSGLAPGGPPPMGAGPGNGPVPGPPAQPPPGL